MAKLTTVTSGTVTSGTDKNAQNAHTAQATLTNMGIDINALANTSDTPTAPEQSRPPSIEVEDTLLLEDELLIDTEQINPPKRSQPIKDITKNPFATTLAVTLLSFGIIGGLALVWWGVSAAQNRATIADETEPLEDIIEDEKQKEIEQLQQELYEQRANVALKDLKAEETETETEDEIDTVEDSDGNPETDTPTIVATSTAPPPPRRSTSPPPPPPPRRVTPTPVRNSANSQTASSSTPSQPHYDSPSQWFELAALGQIGATDFDEATFPPPPSTMALEPEAISTDTEDPVMPRAQGGWADTGLAMVTVNGTNNTPWPSTDRHNGERSQGEMGILERQPTTQPAPTSPPSTSLDTPHPDTTLLARAKGDPWKTAASTYTSDTTDTDTIVFNADDFWDTHDSTENSTHGNNPIPQADTDIEPSALTNTDPPEHQEEHEPDTFYVEPAPPITTALAIDEGDENAIDSPTTEDAIDSPTTENAIDSDATFNEGAIDSPTAFNETWDVAVDPNEGWEDTAPQTTDGSWNVAVDPNEGWEDTAVTEPAEQVTTVAIGTIAKAKVITPIIWDMEAPRATDGIFTIELTEPMEGINGEIVLPKGTRLIGDVSHVTSVGHVYQSIVAIHLPNGQQIPVPVIDHEIETGAPITPLVVRGKKGEALIADAVERSDADRNSLGNDVLIGVVNGLADAADNALEPETSVQVNQGFGSSTVESQENVNDPTAAFARGFLESTAHRMEERLYEETEEILVFQVDAGEKVSVVVNGLMAFNIPAGGWSE